jgi:hypothetical protein
MRHVIILAGLLIATPAIAENGTYRGGTDLSTVYSPSGFSGCLGSIWQFTLDGGHVEAQMIPVGNGGLRHRVSFAGDMQADGSLKMSAPLTLGTGIGMIYVDGKFTDSAFEGVTYSSYCHARLTATK